MGTLLFFWALGEFLHAVDILRNGRVTDLFKIGPELVTVLCVNDARACRYFVDRFRL